MRGISKQHLPSKICLVCGRPFVWRKKWERDWEQVRYCSDGCRMQAKRVAKDVATKGLAGKENGAAPAAPAQKVPASARRSARG